MQKRFFGQVAPAALVLSLSSLCSAHLEVSYPPTRYELNGTSQKTGPCATGTPTGIVTELVAGEQVTVTWDETVNHPGHFRVSLDLGGADDYPDPASENDMAVTGNVVAYIPDDGGSAFSHTFTVPDQNCDPCSIQVIQVMTDKLPWGPTNGDDIYYWCSDIRIVDVASTDTGTGTGTSTGTGTGTSTGTSTGTGTDSGTGGSGSGGSGNTGASSNSEDRDFSSTEDGCSIGSVGESDGERRSGRLAGCMMALAAVLLIRRR